MDGDAEHSGQAEGVVPSEMLEGRDGGLLSVEGKANVGTYAEVVGCLGRAGSVEI